MRIQNLKLIACITFFIYALKTTVAHSAPYQKLLTTNVVTTTKRIFPYESVGVLAILRNDDTVDHTYTLTYAHPKLRPTLSVGTNDNFVIYTKPSFYHFMPPPPRPLTLKTGESSTIFENVNVDHEVKHVFAKPGLYHIVSSLSDLATRAEQSVEVVLPSRAENEAWQYLNAHPLYLYFDMDNVLTLLRQTDRLDWSKENHPSPSLEEFIRRFPMTRYAQWAKPALLYVEAAPVSARFWNGSANKNRDDLERVRKKFEAVAPQLPDLLQAECWVEAGKLATLRDDTAQAVLDFAQARLADPSPARAGQIEVFQEYIKANSNLIDRLPQPAPIDTWKQAIIGLEKEGYDVEGFKREHRKEDRELVDKTLPFLNEFEAGKITEMEYYQKMADLMVYYIKKYSKPLSQEELQRRKRKYLEEKKLSKKQ